MTSRRQRSIILLASAALVLTACGTEQAGGGAASPGGTAGQSATVASAPASASVETVPATEPPASTESVETVPTTEPPTPPSTEPPAPPSTQPPAPTRDDLVLRATGVGAAEFGQSDVEVLTYTNSLLGAPLTDQLGEYPTFQDDLYVNLDDDAFILPFGRSTCYDNQFCLYFGGDTPDALTLVGWSQFGFELTSAPLRTGAGFTISDRVGDFPGSITLDEGGCFSTGTGSSDGMTLFVSSEGEPFQSVDDAGNFITNIPDPALVVINGIQAGERPFFLFADC